MTIKPELFKNQTELNLTMEPLFEYIGKQLKIYTLVRVQTMDAMQTASQRKLVFKAKISEEHLHIFKSTLFLNIL